MNTNNNMNAAIATTETTSVPFRISVYLIFQTYSEFRTLLPLKPNMTRAHTNKQKAKFYNRRLNLSNGLTLHAQPEK